MDRKMLTSMVYAFASIILGVSFCSLFDHGDPMPSRNSGESKRLFSFLFVPREFYFKVNYYGCKETWRKIKDDPEASGNEPTTTG